MSLSREDGSAPAPRWSAKAEVEGMAVSLGTQLETPLALLKAELDAGKGVFQSAAPRVNRLSAGTRRDTGAKFIKN